MHLEDTLTECDSSSSVDESTYGRTTSIVYFSFKLPLYTLWHPLWPSIREFIVLQINEMLASAINTVAVHSAERKKTAKQNMRMGCNHAISAVIKCTDRRWAVVFLSFCIVFSMEGNHMPNGEIKQENSHDMQIFRNENKCETSARPISN